MTTKVKSSATSRKSSTKVTAKELQTVVNSVSAPAPAGSGVGSGASGSVNSAPAVGVGSSSASTARAKRIDFRAKLENSTRFEGFTLSCGVRELSAKLGGFFSAKEWTGTAAETVRASLDNMLSSGVINEDQRDMMWRVLIFRPLLLVLRVCWLLFAVRVLYRNSYLWLACRLTISENILRITG